MTILSGQTIRRLMLVEPMVERSYLHFHDILNTPTNIMEPPKTTLTVEHFTVSHGLSSSGYDVRVEFDEDAQVGNTVLRRGDFILASTIERIKMPDNVVGIVHDKSSWARRGIAVQNTVIEPGWCGYLTLELSYHGRHPITIPRGVGIAQVVFHYTDFPVEQPYDGKYQDQARGPQEAR